MVTTLLKSTLREIRQSLGRYLAILAIVGLGVGFFAGLRMSTPTMAATGVKYLDELKFYDFRLLSTLGFTKEDVDFFAGQEGIAVAQGSVNTEFLWRNEEGEDIVLVAHMLTEGINEPRLTAGRMPEKSNECLVDADKFTAEMIGREIKISLNNDEDTRDLLVHQSYTIVGLAQSPIYLNYERGTASIGSGSITAFVLMPEESFDSEAYHEIFLRLTDREETYSQAYEDQIDLWSDKLETLTEERGDLRYTTLYTDAMEEIRDGEQELADGWEEYRTERADAEQELADAYQELTDGEEEYADGLADYEQGKIDYADGVREVADAEQELADGWQEYTDAKAEVEQELADALKELEDGEKEYADGLKEWEDGQKKLDQGRAELNAAGSELHSAQQQLNSAKAELDAAKEQLDQGEAGYQQAETLYQTGTDLADKISAATGTTVTAQDIAAMPSDAPGYGMLDSALGSYGTSMNEFQNGWNQAAQAMGGQLNQDSLAATRDQLDQGQSAYQDGLAKYEDGLAQYNSGLGQAAAAQEQISAGQRELDKAKKELEEARQKLDDGWKEYEEGKAEAEQELADAEQELLDAEQKLADARIELADAKRDLDKAPSELADARKELDDGWVEYYDGLAEAEQEFADAEQELADGEQEIADAYVELADLKDPSTYALTRSENNGYSCFDNDTAIIDAISVVFPAFYFLVAALVCMTTMKRMVDEQRTQIGVLKALGYSQRQIIGKYLFYSGSAAITGSVLGYALCGHSLPLILWEIYGIMYGFAPLEYLFDPVLAAISLAAALVCSMGATYISCRAELRNPAAELIRPKSPKAGKRVFLEYITPIWKRMDFLHKVSVRNVLRYRSRLIMMVLGIGGCTALLITGFGVKDSIADIANDQFDEITLFDYAVNFQEAQTQEQAAEFLRQHGWEESAGLLVHSGSTDIVAEDVTKSVYLVVSASDNLDGFISLHEGDRAIPYPGAGEVVINYGLAEDLGVSVGDRVELRDEDKGTVEVTVSDICENYIFNYIYVAPATYEEQLGSVPEFKTLYVLAHDGADPYEEGVALTEGDGIANVSVNYATRENLANTLSRLDYIVIVIVFCAGALAFIVLYNLTNINIAERIREIATIKVLGFYQNEVATYVFREIRILSAVGSLAGILMGKALHAFVIAQIQVEMMFFPTKINLSSYLLSLGLTMLFTELITLGMRPRLKKVNMAESLKSIE